MSPDRRPARHRPARRERGSALMIALFVIVVMAMLAAAMGRFLTDSEEKFTVEVRAVRALMAAQSGLEQGLYRLYPNGQLSGQACGYATTIDFTDAGLVGCRAELTCTRITVSAAGSTLTGYRLRGEGQCGEADLSSPNPDFAVSRVMTVEAFDGDMP